jgi:Holliday junction resolvase RusA-like endonuclease
MASWRGAMTAEFFTLFGKPASKKNSLKLVRVRGRVIPIQGDAYAKWRSIALPQLRIVWGRRKPIESPVHISAVFYRDRRCDLVNLIQSIGDLLQEAGIVKNDRLIASWDGSRIVTNKLERERAEIMLAVVQ